jgi:hypothetical protein
MLKGVHILYDLPPDQLRPRLEANFRSAAVIVNTLFDGNPPFQIGHLLYQMHNHFKDKNMFPTHAGLTSMTAYPCLFIEIYEVAKFVLGKQLFRALCKSVAPHSTSLLKSHTDI